MGWWNASWDEMEPETRDSINHQEVGERTGKVVTYKCGCESTIEDEPIWHMCQWHEGFDDGVVTVRNAEARKGSS